MSELAPERVAELIASREAQLVDVRTEEEYEAGHIAEARLIPVDRLMAESEKLDRDRGVVLYCRSGERSGAAAQAFGASGWDAHSMAGGLLAWVEQERPLEPERGEVVHQSGLPPR